MTPPPPPFCPPPPPLFLSFIGWTVASRQNGKTPRCIPPPLPPSSHPAVVHISTVGTGRTNLPSPPSPAPDWGDAGSWIQSSAASVCRQVFWRASGGSDEVNVPPSQENWMFQTHRSRSFRAATSPEDEHSPSSYSRFQPKLQSSWSNTLMTLDPWIPAALWPLTSDLGSNAEHQTHVLPSNRNKWNL